MDSILAIGLMSGTSRDGIDAALIETDGNRHVRPLAFLSIPYVEGTRKLLADCCIIALRMERPGGHPLLMQAEDVITQLHMGAVETLLRQSGRARDEIAVIGFHGHTVAHRPERGWSWQLGDGAGLARMTGIDVVNDFRSADILVGGQGAPLTPVYHRVMASAHGFPAAILNIGGISNITSIAADGVLSAFDCGMGNAMIDDWVSEKAGKPFDENGDIAAKGKVDQDALSRLLDHSWFSEPPPKSLDQDDFSAEPVAHLSLEDGAATLTAFTAFGIALSLKHLPDRPRALMVAGGGRHNATLMRQIATACGLPVSPVEAMGWNGDATEAEAFAYMAVRKVRMLPIGFPGTTGAPYPVGGGVHHIATPIEDASLSA